MSESSTEHIKVFSLNSFNEILQKEDSIDVKIIEVRISFVWAQILLVFHVATGITMMKGIRNGILLNLWLHQNSIWNSKKYLTDRNSFLYFRSVRYKHIKYWLISCWREPINEAYNYWTILANPILLLVKTFARIEWYLESELTHSEQRDT